MVGVVRRRQACVLLMVLVVLAGCLPLQSLATSASQDGIGAEGSAVSDPELVGVQVPFVENRGQVDCSVLFYADTFYGTGYVTNDGITHEIMGENNSTLVVKEQFLDRQGNVINLVPKGEDLSSAKVSYFRGSGPADWQSGLESWNVVDLGEVYPGISVKLKAHGANIEKLFYVSPGADVSSIRVRVIGADSLSVDTCGELVLASELFENVSMSSPEAYQVGSDRENITANYIVNGNTYGYAVGSYDHGRQLVIDPVLSYSTYLGGTADDTSGYQISMDSSGNVYLTGATKSTNFPVTTGAFQLTKGAGTTNDVFVSKLSPDGSVLLYSTYLGGSGDDLGYGIAIDSLGNAYVTGSTKSTDFPVTPGAIQSSKTGSGSAAFVSKLSPDGTALTYSTYLGGTGDYGNGIVVDNSGNAFITGIATIIFPTTPGSYRTTILGNNDAFVAKLNPYGSALVFSTLFGGSSSDYGLGIALDSDSNICISGYTSSNDFPVTAGAFQTNRGATTQNDVFVSKLNPDGSALLYSTFLGGTGGEWCYGMALDCAGNVYVTGGTLSGNFPITPDAYQMSNLGGNDVVLSKLSPDLSSLLYSTYLGGAGYSDTGRQVIVDTAGYAYVTGNVQSAAFPITAGAYQTTLKGTQDGFLTVLGPDGLPVYSTFIGGAGTETGYAIALDDTGKVLVSGMTASADFPVTSGAYQATRSGGNEVFFLKFDLSEILPPVARFSADVTSGYVPLGVQFTDRSTGTISSYAWDFDGDGVIDSTLQSPSHVYLSAGTYTVNLTLTGPNGSDSEVKAGYIRVSLPYVEAFPGKSLLPTDPDDDGLYEDVNGNGHIDFEDVVTYFRNMDWIRGNSAVGIVPFDYNGNGAVDFNDIVLLFNERMGN